MMKFTVLIDSLTRDRNDLFVSVVEAKNPADVRFAAIADYNEQHGDKMAFAEHEGVLIAACAGEAFFAWNPEGLTASDLAHAVLCKPVRPLFTAESSPGALVVDTGRTSSRRDCPELPKPRLTLPEGVIKPVDFGPLELRYLAMCTGQQMPVSEDVAAGEAIHLATETAIEDIKQAVRQKTRFPEVDKLAVISTSHISAENLSALEAMDVNSDLPYWIISTGFGYIIRFETAVQNWEAGCESQPDLMHPFSEAHLDDTFSALCVELKDYGFNGMHLDADADEIEGLQTYEHS